MNEDRVRAVSLVAPSGTGKTTLVEKLIDRLRARGYRIGAIKHDAHEFEIDKPGKDSYRFTAAGAEVMVLTSRSKLALVRRQADSPPVEDLLRDYCQGLDLVLVEGFRDSSLPRIEVCRGDVDSLTCRGVRHDPNLVAVVSERQFTLDVPVLDLNDVEAVTDFVVATCLA